MRYSPKQYAAALLLSLEDKSAAEKKKILHRFLSLVSKKGDSARLGLVIRELERRYLKKEGLQKVLVETVGEPPLKIKKGVEEILGKNILLEEKINPDLIAGIKILVDDELLIDASAKVQLRKLFSS